MQYKYHTKPVVQIPEMIYKIKNIKNKHSQKTDVNALQSAFTSILIYKSPFSYPVP